VPKACGEDLYILVGGGCGVSEKEKNAREEEYRR
jgi:hypothetical protein